MPAQTSLLGTVYNTFFRKNAMMLTTVFGGAFVIQLGFDTVSERVWDNMNKGRQWKDIKHQYVEAADEE